MTSAEWIEHLNLQPHPEGGYFRESYRCETTCDTESGSRNISTAIYFLLEGQQKSHLHRIQSDELWFYHEGQTLEIIVIKNDKLEIIKLGRNPQKQEVLQTVVPAGAWFGARLQNAEGFALVSCTVAPGFDFKDFELANFHDLSNSTSIEPALLKEMCIQ